MAVDSASDPAIPSEPVDVTIVAHDIGPVGGMERQLTHLITGLQRRGHDVTVIGRVCELPPGSGVRFHRVPGPGRPFLIAYPWFLLAGSIAVARRRRGVVQATGAIVLNQVDAIAVHYCQQVGGATSSRRTRLAGLYIRLVAILNRLGERLCYELSRRAVFVCVSEGVAEEMRHYYPRARERVLAIQNGVDVDAFAPGTRVQEAAALRERLGIAGQDLVAAFVGSEWERKGLEQAIAALAQAPGWTLLVAGSGDRERYERLAASLGVQESIRWLGVARDVPLVLAVADALVFPSTYEAFPLVALEAAAAGLPILATPVNGVRELVQDGRSGMLIERDPGSIAAALRRLGEDSQLRRSIGQAAREASLDYSWDRMVERHHELYQRLAGESDAGRRKGLRRR
jgi:UDP-glucose:(heptosyl)LPS alpha-1,3-glucosyltransferase